MKKYEISLFDVDKVPYWVGEYDTMEEMQEDLKCIMQDNYPDLTKIELAIIEQTEDGDNINAWVFATIDCKNYIKGENLC